MKKRKQIFLTIIGGLVSLVIIGALLFVGGFFYLLHKGYFPIPETKDFVLLYSTCIGIIVIVLALNFLLRKRYKFFARGIFVSILFSVFIFYDTTVDLIWYLTPEPFNEKVWKSEPDKPLEMVYSLIRDDTILLGKTRIEAIEMLGSNYIDMYTDDTQITYHIDFGRISYFQLKLNDSGIIERVNYMYYD